MHQGSHILTARFLKEIGFEDLNDIIIYADNLGAIRLAENPVFHQRSKHIDIKYHYVQDTLRNGDLKIKHISTTDMIADVLTKGLPKKKHTDCINKTGMLPCVAKKVGTIREGVLEPRVFGETVRR